MTTTPDYFKYVVKSDPLSNPKVCILTCHDERYAKVAEITVYQNKAEYANRWKHDLVTLTKPSSEYADPQSHAGGISWSRLKTAIDIAKSNQYDWIYVVGSDTLITNMTIPLASLIDHKFHFIICNDMTEWNADSFLMKCSAEAISFMESVLKEHPRLKHHPIVEQQAMIEQRNEFPGIWKVLPQRAMNSYNYDLFHPLFQNRKDIGGNDGHWQSGDFLIHWAGQSYETRWSEIHRVLPLIQR